MTSMLQRARGGETLTDLDIIDMHGHLGRYQFNIPDPSPAALVAVMDRIGVRMIVCSHMSCLQGGVERGNQAVLEAIRAHPGRIAGYVTLWPSSADDVRAEAQRRLAEGFIGVKLHNINGFAYTDPAYAPALGMANERRMPLLLHTWGKDEEFEQVETLVREYPEISILLAHAGASSAARAVRTARELDNVYLDPSYSLAPRGL
ncbi:hypothetical protein LCGC14_2809560, partial [marine sediment metagenome]